MLSRLDIDFIYKVRNNRDIYQFLTPYFVSNWDLLLKLFSSYASLSLMHILSQSISQNFEKCFKYSLLPLTYALTKSLISLLLKNPFFSNHSFLMVSIWKNCLAIRKFLFRLRILSIQSQSSLSDYMLKPQVYIRDLVYVENISLKRMT